MTDIVTTSWSEVDNNNNQFPPEGWPAGMLPNAVEPTARMNMGALKRFWNRVNPIYVTASGATTDTYIVTPTTPIGGYGLFEEWAIRPHAVNQSTSPTLSISGFAQLPIKKFVSSSVTAVAAGDIQSLRSHRVYWDGTQLILRDPNGLGATTGSGAAVLQNSPTLVAPALGTPSSGNASNLTNIPGANITAGTVANAALAQVAARTIKGNNTGSTANVADIAAGQLPATNTNDNAAAGLVGEVISSDVAQGSAVSLVTGTSKDITTISLTAGDWDVWATAAVLPTGSTTMSAFIAWINTSSASPPTPVNGGAYINLQTTFSTGNIITLPVGRMRLSLSGTTTVYLSINVAFGASTCAAYGFLGARRMR